jgi:hypothetical protein
VTRYKERKRTGAPHPDGGWGGVVPPDKPGQVGGDDCWRDGPVGRRNDAPDVAAYSWRRGSAAFLLLLFLPLMGPLG